MNPGKFPIATTLGATLCVNPKDYASNDDCKKKLMEKHPWGYDYTFDCTGNVNVMRNALELAHRGWGESCVVGVAAAGHDLATRPFQLITGKVWKGTAFGGWKSRTEVPQLVQRVMRKELDIDPLITHNFDSLEKVNDSITALHSGECLRAIVKIADFTPAIPQLVFK
jgi:Zn-dependent alcohol dehydrogenase